MSEASRGNRSLLDQPLTALFCSSRCPGDLILQAYDAAQALRDAGVAVIGGFHTPIEKPLHNPRSECAMSISSSGRRSSPLLGERQTPAYPPEFGEGSSGQPNLGYAKASLLGDLCITQGRGVRCQSDQGGTPFFPSPGGEADAVRGNR